MSTPSSGRPSPKKRDYHHGDLRRTLLDTAVDLVAEHDICALTLREVARRAGVTHAAPYHHFPSKAALVAAVAEEGYDALYASQSDAADQAGADPVERLRALGLAYVKFAMEHPGHFRVMFRMDVADWTHSPSLAEAAQRNMILLSSTIHQVIETQHLEMDLMELTLAAWTVAHGLATLWVDGPLRRSNIFPHDGMLALAARVIGTSTARLYERGAGAPEVRRPT
jgi:AcrR family transcriptional regulator